MKIVEVSREGMEARVSRFDTLVPMQQQKPEALPPEAIEAITAPRLYPVLSPKEDNARPSQHPRDFYRAEGGVQDRLG